MKLEVYGLKLPEIKSGDELSKLIVEAAYGQSVGIQEGDVIVVTSKIVSKSKGYITRPQDKVSRKIEKLSKILGKPPWQVESILKLSKYVVAIIPVHEILKNSVFPFNFTESPEEAKRLLEVDKSFMPVEMRDGRIASDAGIDASNVPVGCYVFTSPDPDEEAREIAKRIRDITGKEISVVLTDTELSITKFGSIDVAIGSYGIEPIKKKFASKDRFGKPKYGEVDIVVDEVAATAALLTGQSDEGIPVVIVRGISYKRSKEGLKTSYISQEILRKGVFLSILSTIKYKFFDLLCSIILIFQKETKCIRVV